MKTFWFAVLTLGMSLCAAQTSATAPFKSVTSIRDVEVGMSPDLVNAGLTKEGYTLRNEYASLGVPVGSASWVVLRCVSTRMRHLA